MLQQIFLKLLDMSVAAGYCAVFVIVIRLLMKKLPKSYSYVLWAVVFVRLMLPVVPESTWSFMPGGFSDVEQVLEHWNTAGLTEEEAVDSDWSGVGGLQFVSDDADSVTEQEAHTGMQNQDILNNAVNMQQDMAGNTGGILSENVWNSTVNDAVSIPGQSNTENAAFGQEKFSGQSADRQKMSVLGVLSQIWLAGSILCLGYGFISNVLFEKRLKGAVQTEAGVYELAGVPTAFVTGIVKPRIYLPADLSEEYRRYVLTHEQIHIRRGDIWIKRITYFLTCIHWFNPLAWISFWLMCRDMEMSCDESVLRTLGMEEKQAYSTALLAIASGRRVQPGMPIAFSENDARKRIVNVLNYRKQTFGAAAAVGVLIFVLVLGFLCDPSTGESNEELIVDGEKTESAADPALSNEDSEELAESAETESISVEGENWRSFLKADSLYERWIDSVFIGFGEGAWFEEYNGEKLQRIPGTQIKEEASQSPAMNSDIIFYQADAGEKDVQEITKKMIGAMMIPLMEPSEDRSFTVTGYVLEEQPMLAVETNDMWLIKYLNGYYEFEGTDTVSMEQRLKDETARDGMVSFEKSGSEEEFIYLLMELNGIYRLQRLEDMLAYKDKEVYFEYEPIYTSDISAVSAENMESLSKKLSKAINLIFLISEYEQINEFDPTGVYDSMFEFVDRDFFEDGIINYYWEEEKLYEAMARKTGQSLGEFLTGHNLELTGYHKLYRSWKGDAVYMQAVVTDVKWLNDSRAEITYSCGWFEDGHDSRYFNGVVVMEEKDSEMIFVSNKKINN